MIDWTKPVFEFIERARADRVRASEFDGLSNVMLDAWNRPHRWCIHPSPGDDGILAVICCPKISKRGTRYWTWGYKMTFGKIHWQSTKFPYME